MSENLTLKYPNTFEAIRSSFKADTSPDSLLSVISCRKSRYWPDSSVNSNIFHARFPDKQLMLRMANLATKRRIQFWHPWHMEVTHKNYSLKKDIDWFVPPTGDHEWIDSLVRFNHMIDLTAAYQFTNKKKYLLSFEYYLNSFFKTRNKPGRHWKYLVNVAVRVINLIRAYDLIANVKSLPLPIHLTVFENIIIDIKFLLKSLDKSIGNGAFFATTALLIASEFFEEIFHIDEWKVLSEQKLYEILNTEIQLDWMEVEQVPMYHGEVILALLDYCIALKANLNPVNITLKNTIHGMLDTLTRISDPEGIIPPIGDSDRYSIVYIIDLYNVVFKNEFRKMQEGFVRILDDKNGKQEELITLDSTGWAIIRWNCDIKTQGYLLFDCSGKPTNHRSGHSHADDLQFLLHTTNGPVFIDPGRFTYCTDFKAYFPFTQRRIYPSGKFHRIYSFLFPEFMDLWGRNWKEYFRQTLSHNTISLNGKNQPGYSHREARSQTNLLEKKKIGSLVLLKGYLDSNNMGDNVEQNVTEHLGYQHQRSILGCLPNIFIIVDQMKAEKKHSWVSSYHLDTGSKVSFSENHLLLEVKKEFHKMYFLSSSANEHKLSIDDDWVSHIYNKKQPSKTIRALITQASEAVLVTVIQTHANDSINIIEANVFKVSNQIDNLTEDIYVIRFTRDDIITNLIVNPKCKSLKYGGLEFNAMYSLVSRVEDNLHEAGFICGTYLHSHDFSLTCSEQEGGVFQVF